MHWRDMLQFWRDKARLEGENARGVASFKPLLTLVISEILHHLMAK